MLETYRSEKTTIAQDLRELGSNLLIGVQFYFGLRAIAAYSAFIGVFIVCSVLGV